MIFTNLTYPPKLFMGGSSGRTFPVHRTARARVRCHPLDNLIGMKECAQKRSTQLKDSRFTQEAGGRYHDRAVRPVQDKERGG